MPKFKFVVTCEKIIFDQAGPVSLIGLFQRMNIQLQGAPLPDKAISYARWHVFSLWENDPKEVGQPFTYITKVFNVDGSIFNESEISLINNEAGDSQTKINILFNALPIWMEGDIWIRVWLKGVDEEAGSCKFSVVYQPKGENVEAIKSGPS